MSKVIIYIVHSSNALNTLELGLDDKNSLDRN